MNSNTLEFEEGKQAYKDGLSQYENPYSGFTEGHEEWENGWYDAWGEWYQKDFAPEWFENR